MKRVIYLFKLEVDPVTTLPSFPLWMNPQPSWALCAHGVSVSMADAVVLSPEMPLLTPR